MRGNVPRWTRPELALRAALAAATAPLGRWHARPLAGLRCEADVLYPAVRVAVFLDGCFWHSCPRHGARVRTHGRWWRAKLAATRRRDRRNDRLLRAAGWTVVRAWEHVPPAEAARRVLAALRRVGRRRAS